MAIARVTDHVQAGLDLLIQQYRDKPRIAGWLTAYLNRCQELEDAIWSVIVGRLIDAAEGVQLDALGSIVGQVRQGEADELYRIRIRARIAANKSLGTPDDVLNVAIIASNKTPDLVFYTELYPATFHIELFNITAVAAASVIHELIHAAKPPGVGFALLYSSFATSGAFTFSDDDSEQVDAARGFTDNDDPSTAPGGRWIDVIT